MEAGSLKERRAQMVQYVPLNLPAQQVQMVQYVPLHLPAKQASETLHIPTHSHTSSHIQEVKRMEGSLLPRSISPREQMVERDSRREVSDQRAASHRRGLSKQKRPEGLDSSVRLGQLHKERGMGLGGMWGRG